ncbi:MAG: DUF4844 domain-containing protein [Bacteroidetes bacterium]|nr:DUF4844 domain-containing protein [Bacteroidota bacterium]
MKKLLFFFISLFALHSVAVNKENKLQNNSPENIITGKLESFIKEKKFQPDEVLMYPGINSKPLKTKLTELVNESAKDFMQVAASNPSDESYQIKIKAGLERFNTYYSELSSEDLDRIYHYFEQLIEIVGLKNPGNYLKKWRYG